MQGSKRDQKIKSGNVYQGEMWDEDEIEEEYHKFLKKKKKIHKKELPPPKPEEDDDVGF